MTLRTLLAAAIPTFLFLALLPRVHAAPNQKKLGAALYHTTGCEHCHGPQLLGGDLGPDISIIGKQWTNPQIEHQIVHGGGGMPAFADALQPDEITALVAFLHSKRKPPKHLKTPPAAPSTPQP